MSTAASRQSAPRQTTFGPLRHGVFAAIWSASIFSAIGGQLQQVGAAWMMTSLDPSSEMVALVTAASTLPILLFALLAGALADVIDRRKVLFGAQLLMFSSSTVLAVLAYLDLVTPYLLLLLTFIVGVGVAIMAPAWQSIVAELVPRDEVPAAVGLNIMAFNIARTIGPAAGGIIVAWAGPRMNFTLNAVSYLALITVLVVWHPKRAASTLPAEAVIPAMQDGILYAFHSSQVRRVMLRALAFGFCTSIVIALMALVARDLLGQGAAAFGILMGCMGFGAVVGATGLAAMRRMLGAEWLIRLSIVITAAALVVVGLSRSLPLTCAALLLIGGGSVLGLSTFNVTVQMSVPRWVSGRALALYQMFAFGGLTLGAWFWGALGEVIGISGVYLVSAGATAATLLLAWRMPLREVHESEITLVPTEGDGDALPLAPADLGVVVVIEYRIPPERLEAFISTVTERQRLRLRDGARQVTLLQDAEHPERWAERFFVRNWTDYRRKQSRRTIEAKQLDDRLADCHDGPEAPTQHFYFEQRIRQMPVSVPAEYPLA